MPERSLSICIPTHHGRALVLREALESVLSQPVPDGWQLELCVSDNASADGTAEMVAQAARGSEVPVRYLRSQTDQGLGRNIAQAASMATGRWCWLMGSDDHLASDALATVTSLLEAHPEVAGLTQPRANFSPDMLRMLEPDRPGFFPDAGEVTCFEGIDDVLGNVGHSWTYLGCHVVRTDLLAGAQRAHLDEALSHPIWPQVVLYGRLARRDPRWLWHPHPVLRSRSESSFFTTGAAARDLGTTHVDVVRGLALVWRSLTAPDDPSRRELMNRTFRVWASPPVVRVIKSRREHGVTEDLRLLAGLTAALWRLPAFRRSGLPALLAPGVLVRRRQRRRERAGGPTRPLRPAACSTELTLSIPSRLPPRRMAVLDVEVRNSGDAVLASADPLPVQLSYRWLDSTGRLALDGLRAPLGRPLARGDRVGVRLRVLTPWEPGHYELRVAPVQENTGWFDDLDPANGARAAVYLSADPDEPLPERLAATWIAVEDAGERADVLGATNAACERVGHTATLVVEGAERRAAALDGGRQTGVLVIPALHALGLDQSDALELVERARDEGWRLLVLDMGVDSAGSSTELFERHLARVAAHDGRVPDVPVAPPELRRRVGARGADKFRRAGMLHVDCYAEALGTAGVSLAGAGDLLDWGAGPGRMTAHLLHRAPDARITAVDTDSEAIAWLDANLAVESAHTIPLTPPTALVPESFDVVIGHSVFSHLSVEAQDLWLAELARVTRPGGTLAVSVNGRLSLAWHREHPLAAVPASVEQELEAAGVAVWDEDGWEEEFYPGYHTTFHAAEYVREHWSRWFDVLSIQEGAATPGQDIVLLRSRGQTA